MPPIVDRLLWWHFLPFFAKKRRGVSHSPTKTNTHKHLFRTLCRTLEREKFFGIITAPTTRETPKHQNFRVQIVRAGRVIPMFFPSSRKSLYYLSTRQIARHQTFHRFLSYGVQQHQQQRAH